MSDDERGEHLAGGSGSGWSIDMDAARLREAQMRANGHMPPTDEEAQRTFDETIAAIERDPGCVPGGGR